MREIRPSGSEGGVAPRRHPYPYRGKGEMRSKHSRVKRTILTKGMRSETLSRAMQALDGNFFVAGIY
jgi:hypothetical protein